MRTVAKSLALAAVLAATCRAQDVVAVLGSELGPYREAYESFQAAVGVPVPLLPLDYPRVPKSAKVVATFGGRAAANRFPGRVTLVYALAPGFMLDDDVRLGPAVKIRMEPEPSILLKNLVRLQPGLKRLAVLWASKSEASLARRVEKEDGAHGIKIVSVHLEDADELPEMLRKLKGRADAVWLPADPLLINPQSFEVIRQFSYDNAVPFYAPSKGLVERGATAAVSVSFAEIGRLAGEAAKAALSGDETASDVYATRVRVSINLTAAKRASLTVPPDAVESADEVFR
ncbi:MAG: hypothetical protein HY925_08175 [Elusimicrobia bacterium]|nr:hypothetical protein [Elusimicrobiota bacterium]